MLPRPTANPTDAIKKAKREDQLAFIVRGIGFSNYVDMGMFVFYIELIIKRTILIC